MRHPMSRRTHPRPGRHRALPPRDPAAVVPPDVHAALALAVTAVDGDYRDGDWTFAPSNALMAAAARTRPQGQGRDLVVFSPECRWAWVSPGQHPEAVVGRLVRATPLTRTEIEWLLADAGLRARGRWHLTPVATLGWLCTGRTRLGRRRHALVGSDRRVHLLSGAVTLAHARDLLTLPAAGSTPAPA